MLRLTPEAAAFLHNLRPAAAGDGAAEGYLIRVVPAAPDEIKALKLSFVETIPDDDLVIESQGFYLSVDRSLSDELGDKLIDLTPGGESVYLRTAAT